MNLKNSEITTKNKLKETTKKKKNKDIFFMIPYEPKKENFDQYDNGSEFDYIGKDY